MSELLPRLLGVLRDHLGLNLQKIHPRVTRRLYAGRATVRHCDGTCCRGGATVSVAERDRVLRHADIVSAAMTSPARRDPSRWFSRRLSFDADFTAGWTTWTRVADGACVFYRSDGLCALQVAGSERLGSPFALKPSVCLLWPLCIQDRTLEVGYAWFTRRKECCAPVKVGGRRTILEVMGSDERLIAQMSRPENSRGGGPPGPRGARPPEPPCAPRSGAGR
ncbi:MAG TPA: DUF3109 family protein [Candidatus Polarisedimenticolia bacterium]|nr:DUF3109 family protein [Candidatus Polarisedimenticolia bacterium]